MHTQDAKQVSHVLLMSFFLQFIYHFVILLTLFFGYLQMDTTIPSNPGHKIYPLIFNLLDVPYAFILDFSSSILACISTVSLLHQVPDEN